ncbi:DUF1150 family protein [Xinfangfangia sp. D13-10-4-6]|uniref:DUF1150 family protein n=1 Tax=Pseudogemmobacter hezensis TaxID=2737662 RepID=UPI0015535723|nr:DUF1150 family protein [Pseudogemmobacter hezensis]NPD17092.1 DUF1150 family protein [Pseudogemmobacter hezensis]
MTTPFEGFPEGKSRIVYVRPVPVGDLPDEVRAQLGDQGVIYSVNAIDGQRLALVADRALAFNLARAHDFAPMSVH